MQGIRTILVVHAQCGDETVVVRNPDGFRQHWQLPGRRSGPNPTLQDAITLLHHEAGVTVEECVATTAEVHQRSRQQIALFRIELPEGSIDRMVDPAPNGHRVQRVLTADLERTIGLRDLRLIG